MKLWWIRDPARLREERQVVESLSQNESWFELTTWRFLDGNLCAEGNILVEDQKYPVRLVYPDQYPEVPAWVEPQDKVRWTNHQYGSGILCLELRPDNWIPSATGADVIRSAFGLLAIENPLGSGSGVGAVQSAHHVGEIQAYDWGQFPALISEGCRNRLRLGTSRGTKALRWPATDEVYTLYIHDEVDRELTRRPPDADYTRSMVDLPVYTATGCAPTDVSRDALVAAVDFDPESVDEVKTTSSGVALIVDSDDLVVYHLLGEGETFRRRVFILPDESGIRSNRSAGALTKSVALVGVGSVGSKIAESLVRSGITRLVLVDGDVFLPGNIERHALDWLAVGARKAQALKRKLLNIAPGITITAIAQNLNWQRSARLHSQQVAQIASCEAIVDATGDPGTSLLLGAIADSNKRAFVSVEVFEGGIGALVACCVPPIDAPFAHARASFLAWCESQDSLPPQPGPGRYEMLSGDGTPFAADDAAVSMTASHATRCVLDILDDVGVGQASPWLLLGYRKAWLFEGHGHTVQLNVGLRQVLDQAKMGDDEVAFILSLVEEKKG